MLFDSSPGHFVAALLRALSRRSRGARVAPADNVACVEERRDSRGLVLGSVVCGLAALGLVITLMPRTDPQQWGAIIVVGVLGPIGGIILASLAGMALRRAAEKPARVVARVGLGLSIAGIISALSLWTL